jgi:hypothetical protein
MGADQAGGEAQKAGGGGGGGVRGRYSLTL